MDRGEVGRPWNGNALDWTELTGVGFDVYRDHFNLPAFFALMPDVTGIARLDIGCGEEHETRCPLDAAHE